MGFSPYGLVVGLAVLAPNLLLVWLPPVARSPSASVPLPLVWLERAGQAACLVFPAITRPGQVNRWWLIVVALALGAYYALWLRYLTSGRAWGALYQPLWILPVPMAIVPVIVFLSAAAWLANPFIAASALVLAAGHIPSALIIEKEIPVIAKEMSDREH